MKEQKLSGGEKARLILRYLRPVAWYFAAGLLLSLFSQVFNALVPQIVRVTVDSILGPEEPQLPGLLRGLLPLAQLREPQTVIYCSGVQSTVFLEKGGEQNVQDPQCSQLFRQYRRAAAFCLTLPRILRA